jgi:hypothetical protein
MDSYKIIDDILGAVYTIDPHWQSPAYCVCLKLVRTWYIPGHISLMPFIHGL